MFQTLLVDDDTLVRKYLHTLEAWEQNGYEIIADACDGEDALRVLGEKRVDVVITDISMPLMDGVELIKRVKDKWEGIHIIVLSCHDEFEYVKEAMRLGADEYILKNTLDEEVLRELLEKTTNQIKGKRGKEQEEEKNKRLMKMGSHSLKYRFFNGILSGTLKGEERETKRGEAGILGQYKNSAVIDMVMEEFSGLDWTELEAEQYSQNFLYTLIEGMDTFLQDKKGGAEIIYLGVGTYCCFLDMSQVVRSSDMRQHLINAASACFRFCNKEQFSYRTCVSSICIGEEGIRQAYKQAREMMKYSFYDDSRILYFDVGKETSTELPKEAKELLQKAAGFRNWKEPELTEAFQNLWECCERDRPEGKTLVTWLRNLDEKAGILRTAKEYQRIHTLSHLKEITGSYIKDLQRNHKWEIPSGISGTVKYAVEFIHQNYKNQIGLTDTAEAVGVNTAYLSYLFKQEMGIGFSNYLQECRMECAKELLKMTNHRIKDVVAEAGFYDYHHFAKTFKKLNGMSPLDYRNQRD